jgi:superfamily I DNA/RNA helicase
MIQSTITALEDINFRRKVLGKLQYLIVDEYQDINPSQARLIKLLSNQNVQVTIVGDDLQSIYQWNTS